MTFEPLLSRASRAALLALVTGATLATACGGEGAKVAAPKGGDLPAALAAAFKEEAVGSPQKSVDLYAKALASAASSPDDPASVPVVLASLDALVFRGVNAFTGQRSSALVDRVTPQRLAEKSGAVVARLESIQQAASGPFARGLVAEARLAIAEREGWASGAEVLRRESGCAREAAVYAPLGYATVTGVDDANDALGGDRAPLPAEVPGAGPFATSVKPLATRGIGCWIPLHAPTPSRGLRAVVVDVKVPRAGTIGVALTSPSAAVLWSGTRPLVARPIAAGAGEVRRFARVTVDKPGTLRLVARVGMEGEHSAIQIGAWDDSGVALEAHAPRPGERPTARATASAPLATHEPKTDDERLAFALGALATSDVRLAESLLHVAASKESAPPQLLLAYGRAVIQARDLPLVKATERARAAYERVLEAWPGAWEAIAEHAELAGARRGRAEANLETLSDLEQLRAKSAAAAAPGPLDALEAMVAGREGLRDRAKSAYERAAEPLAGTALLAQAERVAFDRSAKEAEAFECAGLRGSERELENKRPLDRGTLACHDALVALGKRDLAEAELERLRKLGGADQAYLANSIRSAMETGDLGKAKALRDRMNPGDRTLSAGFAIKGKAGLAELLAEAHVARDAPQAIPGILRAAGDDPLAIFDGVAERVTAEATSKTELANAATVVLAHEERYVLSDNGLLGFLMLDVRRVMGTTDVESNAQAAAPMLHGRETTRVLRRRIFKKDGRVILPDRTPMAAQSHADLSQLEAGDAIEAIYEGFAVPGESGNIGVDTPDLLTERTAVREARIEFRLPAKLRASLWSHDLLGKVEDRAEGRTHVLTWKVSGRPVRRLESGVPKMDRSASVSFSTTTWGDVATQLRDTVAALDAEDPEIRAWAEESSKGKTGAERVAAVASASGQAVKEASGMVLADVDFGRPSGAATQTARASLVTHEGSRTWLVAKALRLLGEKVDILVAENEPYSNSADFPPHVGRFMHPLAVVHLAGTDVWVDADVPGPPLPAGKISPELRGRNALDLQGRIAPMPASVFGEGERDEVDIRLALDAAGNAKGVLTVLLRGRAAQDLAEVLVRIVGLERQRALRGIALAWVPMATVEKVELSSSEGSWQVAIRAELSVAGYAQPEGQKAPHRSWVLPGLDPIHYVFPRPFATTLASSYATHGARENALAINRATQYHVRRRVELPGGAKVARLPGPFDGKGPLLAAARKLAVSGSTVEDDFMLDVSTGTIARDRYDDFVAEARKADDAFRASTRVTPP
jgi:hypothetical protein